MSRAQNKDKKLAVLEIVKKKKDILFGAFQNNAINKIEKEAAWKEVLKKAQFLGLASASREWTYARDHLFGLWKSRTLAKKSKRNHTSVVYNPVDNCILDILRNESPAVVRLSLPESDGVKSNIEPQTSITKPALTSNKTAASQGKKRKRESCDEVKRLKIAILETELYKNKLQILELEKKLGVKRSKFTSNLLRDG
ncbi:uncharacterized protein LOC128854881 [Anastrepha ludens]|uniref:uncharacterized protein LOC128854881 n=1 Tax=Anastrepha ludens TaxID=28586 RepID=UPI0023B18318|nr:uncharacterized protein LOC128854881 [Anastrepha ludens]